MSDRPQDPPHAGQLSLFGGDATDRPGAPPPPADPDAAARAYAVDPRHHVVLEASAGTGKTSVLVARYVNLLRAGVDPANILAITFTRKAAAEMRERIIAELRSAAALSPAEKARWADLQSRLDKVAISTIDAFCLSLLREFPLEADLDPAFEMADETEVPRLVSISLDRTLRTLVGIAAADEDVALVLAQLGLARVREGLAVLIERRLVAVDALERFLARGPAGLTATSVCAGAARAMCDALRTTQGGLARFLADGPSGHPRFALFVDAVAGLSDAPAAPARVRALLDRVSAHFLTLEGSARRSGAVPPYRAEHYPDREAMRRHRDALFGLAPRVEQVMTAFGRDLNVVLARGVRRMFAVARDHYRRTLDERAVLDFSDVLARALDLLRQMDEFSQSRYRLESRYHHVLVDEFQDTSRAQWELVELLLQAWGEGAGLAASPSVFVVGDRKQSIYRFRDAEVTILDRAARFIAGLGGRGQPRRSIARSFRAVPELQHFVNDVFSEISQLTPAPGAFTYDERDRFPVDVAAAAGGGPVLGVAAAATPEACAAAVADEIARLIDGGTVRDKATGIARPIRAGDIAILFRSRATHREFERELGVRGIPTYVYKGLGFFDADEIKDAVALLRYLADPSSPLRAAALLRSGFIRLSDRGLASLAPDLAGALHAAAPLAAADLDPEDRGVLEHAAGWVGRWREAADRVPPADLFEQILDESAYLYELRGARRLQAWENLKKFRALLRRMQNRGYATLPRITEYLAAMSAGDESNAAIDARDAVNLMTVHAAKGLEFPVVFLVHLAKGATAPPRPIRIVVDGTAEDDEGPSVSVGPFVSDADEAERERERHETRRLLYVALTRARDRLYLASTLKDGALVPGRGSLAEVLPDSLKAFIGGVPSAFDEMEVLGWTGRSGREYVFRVCRPSPPGAPLVRVPPDAGTARRSDDFLPPRAASELPRMPVHLVTRAEGDGDQEPAGAAQSSRIFGTLMHRLFEASLRLATADDEDAVAREAWRLLRADEVAGVEDPAVLTRAVARAWLQARSRPDVLAALAGEMRVHEVPFSLFVEHPSPALVRGAIDCVVRLEDGAWRVVEFKTGRRHASHQRQLELYVRAARALAATDCAPPHTVPEVTGVLLYV